jgi:hypothetical protein
MHHCLPHLAFVTLPKNCLFIYLPTLPDFQGPCSVCLGAPVRGTLSMEGNSFEMTHGDLLWGTKLRSPSIVPADKAHQ